MKKTNKPNFIIIGAMKAATTSLYTYLKQHPDVFMTRLKEPMFFNNLENTNDFILKGKKVKKIKTFKDYYSLFTTVKSEKAIGEASPAYIYDEQCARLIKKHLPQAKIIAIIRQPVDRAYSNFIHVKRADREPLSNFNDAFNAEEKRIKENWSPLYHYKSKGFYYTQLKRYFDVFPKKQIKIILFDDIKNNPKKITRELFEFLEIDTTFIPDTSKKANVSGMPKGLAGWIIMKLRKNNLIPNIEFSKFIPKPLVKFILEKIYSKPKKINEAVVKKMTQKYYLDDIKKTEKLISRDLTHWL